MKEYLLIAKGSKKKWDAMNEQEWKPVMDGFDSWIKSMKERNLWIRGDALTEKRADIAKTKVGFEVLDGPFTETKEAMTGFFLFKAKNMADAIEISKDCPALLHDNLQLLEMEGDR
jgi:hypothetical protein